MWAIACNASRVADRDMYVLTALDQMSTSSSCAPAMLSLYRYARVALSLSMPFGREERQLQASQFWLQLPTGHLPPPLQ